MIRSLILVVSILLISLGLNAQSLEDQTFLRVEDLREKLDLSVVQAQKTETILNSHNSKVKILIEEGKEGDGTFKDNLSALRKERDQELQAFFSEDQMALFRVIAGRQVRDIKDYYAYLVETLSAQPEFSKELAEFQEQHKTPAIVKHKKELLQEIDEKDQEKLLQLGIQFNEMLIIALEKAHSENTSFSESNMNEVVNSTTEVNPAFKSCWTRIQNLVEKYDQAIEAEFKEMDNYTTEWNTEIKSILQKYIPSEEEESLDQLFFVLTQYGISRKISKIAFLLFDEADSHAFYQIQANAQELFLKNSL